MKPKSIERTRPPDRFVTKKQILRHILHAAIRLVFTEEDSFAVHLLAQSAEKVCLDLLKKSKLSDPFPLEEAVKPEHRKAFFEIYRQPYNFMKHADRDHSDDLPVYNMVSSNDLLILACCLRYFRLFGETTEHMRRFQWLIMSLYPNMFYWDKIPMGLEILERRSAVTKATRGDLIIAFRETLYQSADYLVERNEDLLDVRQENEKVLERVRPK